MNFSLLLFRRELPCVGDQVLQNLSKQRWIGAHHHARLHNGIDLAQVVVFRTLPDNFDGFLAEINAVPTEAGPRELGQRQQAIGELAHTAHAAAYARQVMTGPFPGFRRNGFLQQGAIAVDSAQRRTQIVRHGI